MKRSLDTVDLGILWNRLIASVNEAGQALIHTAFSRVVTEAYDFTCAVFDADGQMLAHPTNTLPPFMGCVSKSVNLILEEVETEQLRPGDCLICNDPWKCTSQLNDITFISPIFYKGRLVGFAANVTHHVDIGGRGLSADSSEIYEEGLQLPVVKLFDGGQLDTNILSFIQCNVRVPKIVAGDLMAQQAANHVMIDRVRDLLAASELSDLQGLAEGILERSESAMRDAIRHIPNGVYVGDVTADGFDEPLAIKVQVTVNDDHVDVDYQGTADQVTCGLNCAYLYTYAETVYVLSCIANPDMPKNEGSMRAFTVRVPEGSLLNPRRPAALGARSQISMFLQGAIFQALAEAVPTRILAESGSPTWAPNITGTDNHDKPFSELLFFNGGLGASVYQDGKNVVSFPGNLGGTGTELIENRIPIQIERRELNPDGGGAGKYRGGTGQRVSLRCMASKPLKIGMRGERVQHPPRGLFGGKPGAPAALTLDGEALHPKRTVSFYPGSRVELCVAGGGGVGDPRERGRAAVEYDVQAGYVSVENARQMYGFKDTE